MTKFELYCLIYYALDAEWERNHNRELGSFLSGANPFAFTDCGSSEPSVYADFCKLVKGTEFSVTESFSIAKKYAESLNIPDAVAALNRLSAKDWADGAETYLSNPHKS